MVVLPGMLLLAGCTHVVARPTPYYKDGPQQVAQPQGTLDEGTWVMIVGGEGSYTHVISADWVNAWVWTGALKPIFEYRQQEQPDWQEKWQPDKGSEFKYEKPTEK